MLHLLGHPYAEISGVRAELSTTKPIYLLLYLACAGDWVGREELAELFRPEADEAAARHTLRLLLSRAKKWLGAGGLEIEPTRLRWRVRSDYAEFQASLGRGDRAAAAALYRGPLLDGFAVRSTPGFEAWLDLERTALAGAWREAAGAHARDLEAGERFEDAAALSAQLLADDLLAEDAVQLAMRSHTRAGRREVALRLYTAFRKRLGAELGLEPLAETEALAALIRRAEPLTEPTAKTTAAPVTSSAKTSARAAVPVEVQRPPHLVGRDGVYRAVRDSPAPVVLVTGEPGVGKTRLLTELAPGAAWLRCREGLDAVPYFPLVTYLREHTGDLVLEAVYAEELARLVPEAAPGRVPPPSDPQLGKVRLLEAWARYLEALETSGPFGLVFDDLQWADPATLELLLYLSGRGRLRTLGCYRSTEVGETLQRTVDSLRSGGLAEVHELAPLAEADVAALLASLTRQRVGPPIFSRWLRARTGGNPFFMLETLKALFEGGLLREADNHWHTGLDEVTHDYSELEVPPAVAEVVRRRVRSLSEPTRRVLLAAAVVGEGFGADLLSALSGLSPLATAEVLDEAERAGVLRGAAFSHDLVRESLYSDLGEAQRTFLHAQVAERLHADPTIAAEHWTRAGHGKQAADAWFAAALSLETRGLLADAAELLEGVLPRVPEGEQDRLQGLLSLELQVLGQVDRAQRVAEDLLGSADTYARTCAFLVEATQAVARGSYAEAERLTEKALALTPEDEKLGAELLSVQTTILNAQGRFYEALALLEAALKRPKLEPMVYLTLLANQAALYDNLGRLEEALPLHHEAVRLARVLGSSFYEATTVSNLLSNLIDLKRTEEGVAEAERTLARGYPHSDYLRNNLAAAYRRLGRFDEAIKLYEPLITGENQALRAVALSSLAKIYAHRGETGNLETTLEHILNVVTDHASAQGRIYAVVLTYGDAAQKARVRPLAEALDLTTLSPDVREELGAVLE